MKKLAALFLCVLLLAGLLAVPAAAAKNDEVEIPVTGGAIVFDTRTATITEFKEARPAASWIC